MNYGYFNMFITRIGEDVVSEEAEILKFASEVKEERLSMRPELRAIVEKLQPGDNLYVYSFERFCSGIRDLAELLNIIVDDKKANVISITDDFDSSTEAGKNERIGFNVGARLTKADPNNGIYI